MMVTQTTGGKRRTVMDITAWTFPEMEDMESLI